MIMWFVMLGTAVLFAGIMKWYWYGSGNREIRALEMDSKSQLTRDRWGLQCTCFQTPVLNLDAMQRKPEEECRLSITKKAGINFLEIISIIWNKQGILELKTCLGYGRVTGEKVGKVHDVFLLWSCKCCNLTNSLLHLKDSSIISQTCTVSSIVSHKLQRKHLLSCYSSSPLFLMRHVGRHCNSSDCHILFNNPSVPVFLASPRAHPPQSGAASPPTRRQMLWPGLQTICCPAGGGVKTAAESQGGWPTGNKLHGCQSYRKWANTSSFCYKFYKSSETGGGHAT